MSDSVVVKKGITGISIDKALKMVSKNTIGHYDQFCSLVGHIKEELLESDNKSIRIETYHKLIRWIHPKSMKSSYGKTAPVAKILSETLFD
jgi:hypothetical protein